MTTPADPRDDRMDMSPQGITWDDAEPSGGRVVEDPPGTFTWVETGEETAG
jgi:hypothetical protein